MPSVNTEIPSIVLHAYAAASARADHLITSASETFQPPLATAKAALLHARENQLRKLAADLERAYISSCRTYEQQSRKANTDHGQAITRVLKALNERKKQILAEYDLTLAQPRSIYEEVCAVVGFGEDPRCLPSLDALRIAEDEANQVRDQLLADSYAIYLQEKEQEDMVFAERISELDSDKASSLRLAKEDYDAAVHALLPPLEQAVLVAQSAFDAAMKKSIGLSIELRRRCVEVFNSFDNGTLSSFECARRLDQLA